MNVADFVPRKILTDFVPFLNLSRIILSYTQQAATGPSRHHIQGSKIAKGHQSFKVFSSTALKIFLKKSNNAEKNLKGDPLGFFYTQSVAKPKKKLKRGTLWGKFFFRKKSRNAEKTERGSLWSRPALYVMRETFRFCSLGQQVKFEIL